MSAKHVATAEDLVDQVSRRLHDHGYAILCSEYNGLLHHYTLGLQRAWGHPELEVLGLDEALGERLLNVLVERIARGERFRDGDFFSGLIKGYDLFLVRNPRDPAGEAITGERLRLVWPDRRGRYPWHDDCLPSCAVQRTLLPRDTVGPRALQRLARMVARN